MSLTSDQQESVQAIASVCGAVSVVSCVLMGYKAWKGRKYSMIDSLLVYLFSIDLFLSLNLSVGVAATKNSSYCKFQGFLTQWLGLASVLWYTSMSFQLYKFISQKKSPLRIRKKLKRHFIGIIVAAFILAIILLGVGAYGNANIYCWISSTDSYEALRWFFFYFIVVCCWIYAFSCLTVTGTAITSYGAEGGDLGGAEYLIQRKILQYMIVFVFTWMFGLCNRAAEYFTGHAVFVTSVLEVVSVPLQGFLNAACYGGLFDFGDSDNSQGDVTSLVKNDNRNDPNNSDKHTSAKGIEMRPSDVSSSTGSVDRSRSTSEPISSANRVTKLHELVYKPKEYSVFATTYNVGEAPTTSLTPNLKDWILSGHDIYAIGVQECIDLKGLREHILQHLGGPDEFAMYGVEIGSNRTNLGYHGYIALTCYVRTAEIKSGRIRLIDSASNTMATGTNLIVTTAQNKGAVGLLFQVHDTSIGFVTAHLPSDSKGKSKLAKRNASIDSILKEVILAPEDTGFDLHLQHDHIVLMGDLNYRMDTARTAKQGVGASILTNVAEAGSIQKAVLNDDPYWLSRKYNLLRSKKNDPLFPGPDEVERLRKSLEESRSAWELVLQTDELRYIMKYKGVFTGFQEPFPAFPPSYKRKKGQSEADCGDYTDALEILRGYTNTGEVDVEEVNSSPHFASTIKNSVATVVPANRLGNLSGKSSSGKVSLASMNAISEENEHEEEDSIAVQEPIIYFPPKKSVEVLADSTLLDGTTPAVPPPPPPPSSSPSSPTASVPGSPESEGTPKRVKSVRMKFDDEATTQIPQAPTESTTPSPVRKPKKSVGIAFASDGPPSSAPPPPPPAPLGDSPMSAPPSIPPPPPPPTTATVEANWDAPDASTSSLTPKSKARRRQSTLVAIAPTNAKETKKFRPPSYTDRILFHSLPDRENRLQCQAYDFCDEMRASDHRPVSMVLNLEANAAFSCEGSTSSSRLAGGASSRKLSDSNKITLANFPVPTAVSVATANDVYTGKTMYLNDTIELYELIISQLQVNVIEPASDASEADTETSSDDVSILVNSLSNGFDVETGNTSFSHPLSISNSRSAAHLDSINRSESAISISRSDSNLSTTSSVSVASSVATSSSSSKKGKSKKATDLNVDDVTVVFPLPAKDPLIAERKMYDFARAFNLTSNNMISQLRRLVHESVSVDDRGGVAGIAAGEEAFLKITHHFPWKPAAEDVSFDLPTSSSSMSALTSSPLSSSSRLFGNIDNTTQKSSISLTLAGCLSPSLGAHVMLKFANKSGDSLGECVVSLTDLISRDLTNPIKSEFKSIQLTSGGQNRGRMCGVFSLRVLASANSIFTKGKSTKSSKF